MAAACAGGLAHPPGYPLHGLLSRMALWFPFGSALLRLNLVSVVTGALTAGALALAVREWTGRLEAGVIAALAWTLSSTAWIYNTGAEVFSLHACLLATAAALWPHSKRASSFFAGMALTHHHTALFAVAPFLFWQRHEWKAWLPGLVAGCWPLLLLPVFSATPTHFSWGDAGTVSGFFTHLLRREYGTFSLSSAHEGDGLHAFLLAFVEFEWKQLFFGVAALAALGARRVPSRARLAALTVLALSLIGFGALANLPATTPLFRGVLFRFFLMPHLLLCAGAGFAVMKWKRWQVLTLGIALVSAGIVTRPVHDTTVEFYGRQVLAGPAGVRLVQGDLFGNSTRALQACLHERLDVRVVDQQLLTWPWYAPRVRQAMPELTFPGANLHAFTQANATQPFFICGGLRNGETLPGRLVPWGLCDFYVPPGAAFDDEAWWAASEAALPPLNETRAGVLPDSWDYAVRRDVFYARTQRGLYALQTGLSGNDARWFRRAFDIFYDSVKTDEAPQPSTWKNLGIAAGRLGMKEEMKTAFRRYLQAAPAHDADVATLRALVEAP